MTMTETPKFRLPQRPAGRAGGRAVAIILIALVLVVIGIQLLTFLPSLERHDTPRIGAAILWSPEDFQAVALKLEDRNLPTAAAEAWEEYLSAANLSFKNAALIELRIGKLRQNARDYERALAAFYRAERLAGDRDRKLSEQIADRLRECFQQMGRYGELAREMAAHASLNPSAESPGGGQVVAQIGDERISLSDFDRLINERVEATIASRPGMSPDQLDAMRKQLQSNLADPQAKSQHLQDIVASRVLAAQARNEKLDESPEYRQELLLTAESLLASKLLNRIVRERGTVTPEDVERYYTANKARYVTPASGKLAHIICTSREQAQEVIAKAGAGESFDDLAKAYSQDAATKDKGGAVDGSLTEKGDQVPGVGKDANLREALWKLRAGAVLPEPHQSLKGWDVIKVVEKQEAHEPALPEVRDEVEADARTARQQEVAQQYIQELFKSHGVQLFPNAFSAATATTQPAQK